MLVHNVYFTLDDPTPQAIGRLLDSCKEHLSGHPGTGFFGCGVLAAQYQRPVNDRGFHVALHVIFRTHADHDAYQSSERHQRFLEENKPHWRQVRVFDSTVE